MSYTIKPQEHIKLTLNETDPIKSVIQNLSILLATKQGSCPLYRNFGLPMRFIDKPVEVAKTIMIAEIMDAVMEYEPHASIVNIGFAGDEDDPGKIIPTLEVEITDEQKSRI